MEKSLNLLKRNFLIIKTNIVLSVIYLFFIPVVVGIKNLNLLQTINICKTFLIVLGIILIVPISKYENSIDMKESICNKKISYFIIIMIRLIISLVILILLICISLLILKNNNCIINISDFFIGTIVCSIFIGTIGLMISSVTSNCIGGYITSLVTYGIIKINIFQDFNLFPLSINYLNNYLIYIYGSIIVVLLICLYVFYKNKRI